MNLAFFILWIFLAQKSHAQVPYQVKDTAASENFNFLYQQIRAHGLDNSGCILSPGLCVDKNNFRVGISSIVPTYGLSVATDIFVSGNGYFYSNVGIGTTSPKSKLEVYGELWISTNSGNPNGDLTRTLTVGTGGAENTNGISIIGQRTTDDSFGALYFYNAPNTIVPLASIYARRSVVNNSGVLTLNTANSGALNERVRIDRNGNVGIGTTAPSANMHLFSSVTPVFLIETSSGSGNGEAEIDFKTPNGAVTQVGRDTSPGGNISVGGLANAFVINQESAFPIQFGIGNTAKVTIDSSGNMGIGTTAPVANLDVRSGSKYSMVSSSGILVGTTSANFNTYATNIFKGSNFSLPASSTQTFSTNGFAGFMFLSYTGVLAGGCLFSINGTLNTTTLLAGTGDCSANCGVGSFISVCYSSSDGLYRIVNNTTVNKTVQYSLMGYFND